MKIWKKTAIKEATIEERKNTMGKVIIVSVTIMLVAMLLLAAVVVSSVSQVTQTFIKSNPETIDKISMINAASASDYDDNSLILSLLWAKYASGSVGGKVEGSFTGRFTTAKVRKLEKVNLSCIDEYEFVKSALNKTEGGAVQTSEQFLGSLEFRSRLQNKGCTEVGSAGNTKLWRCPHSNCQTRETVTETAGEFIPERIDIRKIEAESTLNQKSQK